MIETRWPLVDLEAERAVVGSLLLWPWPEAHRRAEEVRPGWLADEFHVAVWGWVRRRAREDVTWPERALETARVDLGEHGRERRLIWRIANCLLEGRPSEWRYLLRRLADRREARCRIAKAERALRDACREADAWWGRMRW